MTDLQGIEKAEQEQKEISTAWNTAERWELYEAAKKCLKSVEGLSLYDALQVAEYVKRELLHRSVVCSKVVVEESAANLRQCRD